MATLKNQFIQKREKAVVECEHQLGLEGRFAMETMASLTGKPAAGSKL